MKCVLIFALTSSEAKFAILYKKQHPNENVKIFAPEINAQLELKKQKIAEFDYFLPEHFSRDYYSRKFWRKERQAVKLAKNVLKDLAIKNSSLKEYLNPLKCWLEMAYLEVLDAQDFFSAIEKTLSPDLYYIPSYYNQIKPNIYYPLPSQMALIQLHFIPKSRRKYYSVNNEFRPPSSFALLWKKVQHTITYFTLVAPVLYFRLTKLLKKESNECDILIFSGGRNLDIYRAVLDKLKERNPLVKVVCLTGNQSLADQLLLFRHGIGSHSIKKWQSALQKEIDSKIITVLSEIKSIGETKIPTQKINHLTAKLAHILWARTQDILLKNIPTSVQYTVLANALIGKYSPKLLITTHDPGPTALPFVEAAKKRHIPTLLLIHGWQDTILNVDYESDWVIVWSKLIADWYQKRLHKKAARILIAGYPGLDDDKKNHKLISTFNQRFTASPVVRIGLLLTMYLPHAAELSKFLSELFSAVRSSSQKLYLDLRLHPNQPVDGIVSLAKQLGVTIEINRNVSLNIFIAENDVCLSWDTTALLWCMLQGKPLFYCTPNWASGISKIEIIGGAWLVTSPLDFLKQLEQLRKYPSRLLSLQRAQKQYLKQVSGNLNAESSDTHARIIQKFLIKRKK